MLAAAKSIGGKRGHALEQFRERAGLTKELISFRRVPSETLYSNQHPEHSITHPINLQLMASRVHNHYRMLGLRASRFWPAANQQTQASWQEMWQEGCLIYIDESDGWWLVNKDQHCHLNVTAVRRQWPQLLRRQQRTPACFVDGQQLDRWCQKYDQTTVAWHHCLICLCHIADPARRVRDGHALVKSKTGNDIPQSLHSLQADRQRWFENIHADGIEPWLRAVTTPSASA